jgi:hypothetical protein
MDRNDATRGVSRDLRASEIESFLKQALAGGEKTVIALQEKARAAGLLGERQTITDSKSFRSAKAALGVRSHRIGFGRGAIWFLVLPAPPASEAATAVTLPVVYEVAPPIAPPRLSPAPQNVRVDDLTASRSIGPKAWLSSKCGRGRQAFPAIDGVCSWTTLSGSSAPRRRSAPPNSVGISPNFSAVITRLPTSTLEAQACCGIWLADRSCKSMLMGQISLPPMEGCDGSKGAQFR